MMSSANKFIQIFAAAKSMLVPMRFVSDIGYCRHDRGRDQEADPEESTLLVPDTWQEV